MSQVEKNYKAGGRAGAGADHESSSLADNHIHVCVKINGTELKTSLEVDPTDYVAGPINELTKEIKVLAKSITAEE